MRPHYPKLVHDHGGLPVERLAAEYWRASSCLRGPGKALISPHTATRYLRDLARTCRHDRLRRAAYDTLASLGLHDGPSDRGYPGPEAA